MAGFQSGFGAAGKKKDDDDDDGGSKQQGGGASGGFQQGWKAKGARGKRGGMGGGGGLGGLLGGGILPVIEKALGYGGSRKKGGPIPKTAVYLVHRGEHVVPAKSGRKASRKRTITKH